MSCMFPAVLAVLAQLDPLGRLLPVLGRAVIAALTLAARKRDDVSHAVLATPECRSPSRRPPCVRLRESRTVRPFRARPGS